MPNDKSVNSNNYDAMSIGDGATDAEEEYEIDLWWPFNATMLCYVNEGGSEGEAKTKAYYAVLPKRRKGHKFISMFILYVSPSLNRVINQSRIYRSLPASNILGSTVEKRSYTRT